MSVGQFFKDFFSAKPVEEESSNDPAVRESPPSPTAVIDNSKVESVVIVKEVEKVLEDEETACPVCLCQYASPGLTEPTTTVCGHSLCRGCYQSLPLNSKDHKSCPTCRALIPAIENPNQTILITQLIEKLNLISDQLKKLLRIVKTPNIEAELRIEITKELSTKYQEELKQKLDDARQTANADCEHTLRLQRELHEKELKEKVRLVVEAKDNSNSEKLGRLKNQLDQEKLIAVAAAAHEARESLHAENSRLTLQNEALQGRLAMYEIAKDTEGIDKIDVINKLQAELEVQREKVEMTKTGLKVELDALRRLLAEKEAVKNAEVDELHRLKQEVSDLKRELARQEIRSVVGDSETHARELKLLRERLSELEINNESKSRYINDLKAEVLKLKGNSPFESPVARVASPNWNDYGGNNNNHQPNFWGSQMPYRQEDGTHGRTGKFFTHKNA